MGDRAQLQITDGQHSVFLYTHWGGSELAAMLKRGLEMEWSRSLTRDPSYCVGNVIKSMVRACGGAERGDGLGFGFEFKHNDDERGAPLILNIANHSVTFKELCIGVERFIEDPSLVKWG